MIIRCLIFYFILMAYSPAQLAKPDSTLIKNPKTAFYLSLIPGGGQLYNGKLLKGSVVMGLESLAIYSFLENSNIYKDYDNGDHPFSKGRYLEKRNKYAWWVIFLYFYSMIDALVDAHLSPFDDVMNTAIEDLEGGESEK